MGCSYRYDDNKCRVNNNFCPFVYYCGRIKAYKELDRARKGCKYMTEVKVPDGYKKVEHERRGYLYINMGEEVVKVLNPFDYVPQFVKISKTKNGYKIKK